tara:strand:- start:210 stop:497 length:288 start_codon:yes stop_codon:yes gene_type:complete
MISIGIIECTEEDHLLLHLIFIGIHITIGGIGQVILISIWDSIIGTRLDLITMVGDGLIVGIIEDGHLTNGVILMDGTTDMVGTMGSTIDTEVLT